VIVGLEFMLRCGTLSYKCWSGLVEGGGRCRLSVSRIHIKMGDSGDADTLKNIIGKIYYPAPHNTLSVRRHAVIRETNQAPPYLISYHIPIPSRGSALQSPHNSPILSLAHTDMRAASHGKAAERHSPPRWRC
jgi:hypothetical protein